jgi:hypothetical protein
MGQKRRSELEGIPILNFDAVMVAQLELGRQKEDRSATGKRY